MMIKNETHTRVAVADDAGSCCVGTTDSHTGLSTAEEENFFGKSTSVEPSATRVAHPFVKSKLGAIEGYELAAAGYQGVWAVENTREAIFDAMERKETYATTGPRITVRFFDGLNFRAICLADIYITSGAGGLFQTKRKTLTLKLSARARTE